MVLPPSRDYTPLGPSLSGANATSCTLRYKSSSFATFLGEAGYRDENIAPRTGRTLAEELSSIGENIESSMSCQMEGLALGTSVVPEDLVDEELLEADFDFEELDFDMSGHLPPSDATLQATPMDVDDGVELKAEVSSGKNTPASHNSCRSAARQVAEKVLPHPPLYVTLRERRMLYLIDMHRLASSPTPKFPRVLRRTPPPDWAIDTGMLGAWHECPRRALPAFARTHGGSAAAALHAHRRTLFGSVALTDPLRYARMQRQLGEMRADAAEYSMRTQTQPRRWGSGLKACVGTGGVGAYGGMSAEEREMRAPREEGDFRELLRAAEMAENVSGAMVFEMEEETY